MKDEKKQKMTYHGVSTSHSNLRVIFIDRTLVISDRRHVLDHDEMIRSLGRLDFVSDLKNLVFCGGDGLVEEGVGLHDHRSDQLMCLILKAKDGRHT